MNFAENLNNFAHDFWKDYFHKPKLLLVATMLIYFNMSTNISQMHFLKIFFIYFAVVILKCFLHFMNYNFQKFGARFKRPVFLKQ